MSVLFNTVFGSQTQNSDGSVSKVESNVTTTVKRGNPIFVTALSRVCVNISGTATVVIKSNPFGVNAMDVTLTTLSVSGEYTVPSAAYIVVDVTAISGTVTAVIVANED